MTISLKVFVYLSILLLGMMMVKQLRSFSLRGGNFNCKIQVNFIPALGTTYCSLSKSRSLNSCIFGQQQNLQFETHTMRQECPIPESFLFLHLRGLRSNLTHSYQIKSSASDFLLIYLSQVIQHRQYYNSRTMSQQQKQNPDIQTEVVTCYNYLGMALCNDSQSIKTAEEGLAKLSKNPIFIQILLSVPLISGISRDITKLAVNYTKTYVSNLLRIQNYSLIISAADFMINYLSLREVEMPLKKDISETLIFLLQRERGKSLILSCEQKLVKALNEAVLSQKFENISLQAIALLSYIVIQSVSAPLVNHTQFIINSFINVLKVCGRALKCIQNYSMKDKENFEAGLDLLIIFLEAIRKYLKKLRLTGIQLFHLLNCQDLTNLITQALQLNIAGNTNKYTIFYSQKPQPMLMPSSLVQKHHSIKHKSIDILNTCLQMLLDTPKEIENRNLQLMKQSKKLIIVFIHSVNELLSAKNYYQLGTINQLQIITQIYRYLAIMLQGKTEYSIFLQAKTMLLYGLLMKTLKFSPADYNNFTQDPDEFVNSLYQTVKYDEEPAIKEMIGLSIKQKKEQEPYEPGELVQIRMYENIKTLSANLLIFYTQFIDGSLIELVLMALSVLDSRTVQTKFTKDLFLLVLCIVRKNVIFMDNIRFKIAQVLVMSLRFRQRPAQNQEMNDLSTASPEQQLFNAEYGVLLATIDCYLPFICEFAQQLCESLLVIVEQIIANDKMFESIKILATGILKTIIKTDSLNANCDKIIQLINCVLSRGVNGYRFLLCVQAILKERIESKTGDDDEMMEGNSPNKLQLIINIMNKIVYLIEQEIKNQKQGKVILNQLWNILLEISSNKHTPAYLLDHLRQTLAPVVLSLNDSSQASMEDKLRKCLSNCMSRTLCAGPGELSYISTIYHRFQHSQAKYSLGPYFQLMQVLISYGAFQLTCPENSQTVKLMLEMSTLSISCDNVDGIPRGQSECCEGLLLMQSLIVALGKVFTQQMWVVSLECLYSKCNKDTVYDFMKATIITNILLIIVYAYNFFDDSKISSLLLELLNKNHYFSYKNSAKLYAILLIELLSQTQVPFVQRNYLKILDSSISVLKMIQTNKDSLFDRQQLDAEEEHYNTLKATTINCLNQLDQFSLFQLELQKAKSNRHDIVEKAEAGLDSNKRQYMKQIMNIKKVGDNVRVIFKIKNK